MAAAAAASRSRVKWRTIAGAVALVVITAAATYYGAPHTKSQNDVLPARFEIPEMPGTRMEIDGANAAISPDGRMLAYVASDSTDAVRLWIRRLDSTVARVLPGTDRCLMPFWSPDSRYIGFFQGGARMMKVDVNGGDPERIVDVKGPRGADWNSDGVIIYSPLTDGPLYRVSARGGDGVVLTTLDSTETGHRFPCFLPDGNRFLFSVLPPRNGRYQICLGSLDGKEKKRTILETSSSGVVYTPNGYLVYDRDGIIVAHRFDAKNAVVIGEPLTLGDRLLSTGFSGAPG